MLLTYLFVALLPLGYIVYISESSPVVLAHLETINTFAGETSSQDVSRSEVLEAIGPNIRALIQEVPWFWLALICSVMIYPFLGWWAGKLLSQPQFVGLVILGSIVSQQNVVMVPRNIEVLNLGLISFQLPVALLLIGFQFILLTSGILAQKGQILLPKDKENENGL